MSGAISNSDVMVVERRRDIRIIVSLSARVFLKNRRGANGDLAEFACRAINISPRAVALAAPVRTTVGEWARVEIDQVGRVEGTVSRLLDERGFVVAIDASEDQRNKLFDKISWVQKHKEHEVTDKRVHPRFVPTSPYTLLSFADGTIVDCFVIDLSVSGAAVSADVLPPVGTVLAVGKIVGRVVRHFAGAFAVQFVQMQNHQTVESLAIIK
jgi:hypothetical protein